MPRDNLPCSSCPIRDLGVVYPIKDPRDPWRRMPKLMDQLVATFGKLMFNRKGKTRIDTEHRIQTYCARVRSMHGEPCSRKRMAICGTVIMGVAERASRSGIPYPIFRSGLTAMLSSDMLYEQLQATRPGAAPLELDFDQLTREIEHVV
jgi:hypothetical protein